MEHTPIPKVGRDHISIPKFEKEHIDYKLEWFKPRYPKLEFISIKSGMDHNSIHKVGMDHTPIP